MSHDPLVSPMKKLTLGNTPAPLADATNKSSFDSTGPTQSPSALPSTAPPARGDVAISKHSRTLSAAESTLSATAPAFETARISSAPDSVTIDSDENSLASLEQKFSALNAMPLHNPHQLRERFRLEMEIHVAKQLEATTKKVGNSGSGMETSKYSSAPIPIPQPHQRRVIQENVPKLPASQPDPMLVAALRESIKQGILGSQPVPVTVHEQVSDSPTPQPQLMPVAAQKEVTELPNLQPQPMPVTAPKEIVQSPSHQLQASPVAVHGGIPMVLEANSNSPSPAVKRNSGPKSPQPREQVVSVQYEDPGPPRYRGNYQNDTATDFLAFVQTDARTLSAELPVPAPVRSIASIDSRKKRMDQRVPPFMSSGRGVTRQNMLAPRTNDARLAGAGHAPPRGQLSIKGRGSAKKRSRAQGEDRDSFASRQFARIEQMLANPTPQMQARKQFKGAKEVKAPAPAQSQQALAAAVDKAHYEEMYGGRTTSVGHSSAGEVDNQLDLTDVNFFGEKGTWKMPEKRTVAPPQIRRIHLSNLPARATANEVQCIIWGGPLEEIKKEIGSNTATALFLNPQDCQRYDEEAANGIQWVDGSRTIWVKLSETVESLSGHVRQAIELQSTRCVRIIGGDEDIIISQAKKFGEESATGAKRDLENFTLVTSNASGHRELKYRFCKLLDACSFYAEMRHNQAWEGANIQFFPDPCAVAVGMHN